MAAPAPAVCPFCGSADTKAFPDGSGWCVAEGRAFRGGAAVGTKLRGEEVEVRRTKKAVREKFKFGLLGVIGGILGYVGIPVTFVLGAVLRGEDLGSYVSDVFNKPAGAVTCGGVAVLIGVAWYAIWAGFVVWRGHPERWGHLVLAGILVTIASALAGLGVEGAVGIVGGVLALVGGVLAWLRARAAEAEAKAPPAAEST